MPFSAQDSDFITGYGVNTELYPPQLPNKNIFLSSAEGIDSYLFDQYKLCFEKMLLGDPNYFVADIDYQFTLHPYLNGKPIKPLVNKELIENDFKINPYKANREYNNIFDHDGGEDVFVKRSTILKNTKPFYPVFQNDGKKKYIIAYDPATKLDNSIVLISELFRDEEKGLMVKFVNCVNLIEVLKNGEKAVIQKPEQIQRIKDLILDYNRGALDYDNIDLLVIDAGAGGGGTDIAQFLLNEWEGKDGHMHIGFIDEEDPYMAIRMDDYDANCRKLKMFNFKKDKVQAYERAQSAINQGLVIFPKGLNARNELEMEIENEDGSISVRYEKVTYDEMNSLIQMDLLTEELVGMQKTKKPNGTIVFELSPTSKQRNLHDDRADCVAMTLNRLMELRAEEALQSVEKPKAEFAEMLSKMSKKGFVGNKQNPFTNQGANPFVKYKNK